MFTFFRVMHFKRAYKTISNKATWHFLMRLAPRFSLFCRHIAHILEIRGQTGEFGIFQRHFLVDFFQFPPNRLSSNCLLIRGNFSGQF